MQPTGLRASVLLSTVPAAEPGDCLEPDGQGDYLHTVPGERCAIANVIVAGVSSGGHSRSYAQLGAV